MNIEHLFATQKLVDQQIAEKMPADWGGFADYESLMHRKFAFRVEVMELANEIGFFKDWKHSHEINMDKALEELADCLAFLLSVGLTQGYDRAVKELEPFDTEIYKYDDLFDMLADIQLSNVGKFTLAFGLVLGVGIKLGATEEDIISAYNFKASKNIMRQTNGY